MHQKETFLIKKVLSHLSGSQGLYRVEISLFGGKHGCAVLAGKTLVMNENPFFFHLVFVVALCSSLYLFSSIRIS